MSGILDAIRERKAKSLARSTSFSEALDASVSEKAKRAKNLLVSGGEPTAEYGPEMLLRGLFYGMKEDYVGKYFAIPKNTKRSLSLWKRVEKAREEADVPPEVYLRAQFHWFDKVYGKAPTLSQLATEAAIERAQEFSVDKTVNKERRILGNNRPADLSFADIMRQTERQIRDICRAQKMTREEFYRELVLTGVMSIPKQFLDADPIFKRVKAATKSAEED